MPFVFCEAVVVFWVDYCEFSLGEGDSSEREAVSQTTVKKNGGKQYPLKRVRNFKDYFDMAILRRMKSEIRNNLKILNSDVQNKTFRILGLLAGGKKVVPL